MVYFLTALLVVPMLLLVHSYVIFPLRMIRSRAEPGFSGYPTPDVKVTVIIAAYNEAAVIGQKLESVMATTYPLDQLKVWVGSDASTDETDAILEQYACQYPQISYLRFEERTGKPQIVNYLAKQAAGDILILTDADALFYPETLANLLRPFHDPAVGGVQANLLVRGTANEQVAYQEINYNQREVRMKQGEGARGAVIGADGTCYAVRQSLFQPVPEGFYVDDFFIFMSILQQGYQTCFASDAHCIMQVSGDSGIQFRRKVRISKGNFQNLGYFGTLDNPLQSFAGYAFFSHKVIRWIGPFLMAVMLIANLLLLPYHELFTLLLILQLGFYGLGFVDLAFRKLNWYITPLRYVSHFVLMNIALLVGFFQYLLAPGDGTWDSTPKA